MPDPGPRPPQASGAPRSGRLPGVARPPRLGVLGWPIGHSRSPAIQNAALAAAGLQDWRYQLLPVPPALLGEVVPALPAAGFVGANVTIPHKEAALALATSVSERARAIGAANTLVFGPAGRIEADNTDAPAFIAALPFPIAGRTALVLGAGGSARAAVWALLDGGAAGVRVWNRTPERAAVLCRELGGAPVPGAPTGQIPDGDLLVNCTAAGLDGGSPFPDLPIEPDDLARYGCVVDFVYTRSESGLIAEARCRGVPRVDGLTLLIGQGALSFERFSGVPAAVDAMRAAA